MIDKTKRCPKEELYIACEDLDFSWYHDELQFVIEAWGKGLSIFEIAEELQRDPDEVLILLVDLARKERIGKRRGGIFGERYIIHRSRPAGAGGEDDTARKVG